MIEDVNLIITIFNTVSQKTKKLHEMQQLLLHNLNDWVIFVQLITPILNSKYKHIYSSCFNYFFFNIIKKFNYIIYEDILIKRFAGVMMNRISLLLHYYLTILVYTCNAFHTLSASILFIISSSVRTFSTIFFITNIT